MEHICLLKAKVDLSEEEENSMLDYLYTTQYQMGGILSISLGNLDFRYIEIDPIYYCYVLEALIHY